MNLLEVRAAEAGYGANQVLFGVDLVVPEGAVVTLLGRNGMGKTTTLRTIFGLLPLRGGEIRFAGERIDGRPTDAVARLGLALVPEGRHVFPNLSVREHLVAFASNRSGATRPWTIDRVYEMFPQLAARASAMGNQLSGGEQQMLAIGRALMTNPRLLVLDEATEGLAPLVREEIWRCLAALRADGQSILVIDKYIQRLLQVAERHTIVERGRVVWAGIVDRTGRRSAAMAPLSRRVNWRREVAVGALNARKSSLALQRPESRWQLQRQELERRSLTICESPTSHDRFHADGSAEGDPLRTYSTCRKRRRFEAHQKQTLNEKKLTGACREQRAALPAGHASALNGEVRRRCTVPFANAPLPRSSTRQAR